MAVTSSQLIKRLSVKTGSEGFSTASTPDVSLGKYMSTTPIVNATMANLLPNISAAQALAGITVYRCFFIHNTSTTDDWENALVWITSQIEGGAQVAIGLDPIGVVDEDTLGAQAEEIATQIDPPLTVEFSTPSSQDTALAIGTVGPGQCRAIWARSIVSANIESLALDAITLSFLGFTEP